MKMLVVAFALVALAVAAPPEYPKTLYDVHELTPEGGYKANFETENGIKREETGSVKQVLDEEKKPHEVVVVKGSFSYTKPDGSIETINYEADENGFRAFGPSIPQVASRR